MDARYGGMKVQEREGTETQERGTGMQKKGGAGGKWFALIKVSKASGWPGLWEALGGPSGCLVSRVEGQAAWPPGLLFLDP